MRVLYWCERFWPYVGGLETLAGALLPALAARGVELTVVTSHGELDLPDADRYRGIPVHRFPFLATLEQRDFPGLVAGMERVAALKRAVAPDLVHLHTVGPTALFHQRTRRAHRAPVLVTPHAPVTGLSAGPESVLGEILAESDWVTADSAATLADVRRLAPAVLARSSVVHDGLPAPPRPPVAWPGAPHLLCVGRLVPDKGFDVAIEAAAVLRERVAGLRLRIAGDGPARPDLERHASARGVADVVEFLGRVPEVWPVLDAASIVLMPSRWEETFGLVALEAALRRRPVVASRVGALPEVVEEGVTGLLVPKDDPAALADAVLRLLQDPGGAAAMGRAAERRARARFDIERCADAYAALYRRLAPPR
jgi:glycogen(starch) synthase